jgi:hypothetical protein
LHGIFWGENRSHGVWTKKLSVRVRSEERRDMRVWLVLFSVGAVAGALLVAESLGRLRTPDRDPRALQVLTRPLRLSVRSSATIDELLVGLRVHHYRSRVRDETTWRDVFYDTTDGRLAELGWSYRLRERVRGVAGTPWSLRLRREWRSDDGSSLDVRSALPAELGRRIAAGGWEEAVHGAQGLEAADRLRSLLAAAGIAPDEVGPRLRGVLVRTRYELTDKGRAWFELDHERWTFRPAYGEGEIEIEDLVLDTLLKKRDPELERRVRTMDMLVTRMFPFRITDRPPQVRGAEALDAE